MQSKHIVPVSEYVFEIRYEANPVVLDMRGGWADTLRSYMQYKHWQILENRVEVKSHDELEKCFLTPGNAGYILLDTADTDKFTTQASRYLRKLMSLPGFGQQVYISRIGVRLRTCVEMHVKFSQLVSSFASSYIQLTPKAEEAINATLVDVGAPLNFKDALGNFNTSSGPMERDQIVQFFQRPNPERVAYPDVGLFYDIDYFINPRHGNGCQKYSGQAGKVC